MVSRNLAPYAAFLVATASSSGQLMNAIATAPGWIIHVTSPSEPLGWTYDVAISDSVRAVEAVKKLRAFPKDAQFIVKSQLTFAHLKALRLKDGQIHLRRASVREELAAPK